MLTVDREVERKYVADDGFELPPLTQLLAAADGGRNDEAARLVEGEPVRQQLAATYFDTADLRLASAGSTLRRWTGGEDEGWQLQVLAGSGARSEVRRPLGSGARTVPTELQQMVWAQSLGAALRPVAEIATERVVRRLVDVTGQVVAEVADDRVTARRLLPTDGPGDAAAARSWREIDVEPGDGQVDADLLSAVDAGLRQRGLHEASSSPTLARILDLPPGPAAGAGEPWTLTIKSSAGDVLHAHIREQVQAVRAQDLPVRLGAPDAVHKMRVATRRLRSALTTFEPLFAADAVRPLGKELRWLARELGAARDAEVLHERVRTAVAGDAEVTAHPAAALADAELGQAYRTAHDRVLAELDGERYHALLVALDDLVADPPWRKRAAAKAGKTLRRLVARSYTEVRGTVEEADAKPAGNEREELLHDARKAAKRARYAAESVSRIFGEDAVAFATAMEAVQEALGEHQDSVLTRERLRELARHTTSTEAAFLYGRLHALEEAGARQAQEHFDSAWQAAGRTSLHRWLR